MISHIKDQTESSSRESLLLDLDWFLDLEPQPGLKEGLKTEILNKESLMKAAAGCSSELPVRLRHMLFM